MDKSALAHSQADSKPEQIGGLASQTVARFKGGERMSDVAYAPEAEISVLGAMIIVSGSTTAASSRSCRCAPKARLKLENPALGLIVVDYVQLMTAEGENRTQEVTQIKQPPEAGQRVRTSNEKSRGVR